MYDEYILKTGTLVHIPVLDYAIISKVVDGTSSYRYVVSRLIIRFCT
jgi:hypothetical protein